MSLIRKNGKFFADWRTADGARKRKQFTAPATAERYARQQTALAKLTRAARQLRASTHHRQRHTTAVESLLSQVQRLTDEL